MTDVKTKMLIYQSKANLDEKISFGKTAHLEDITIRKMPVRGLGSVCESRIPRSILVHDLCGIEVSIISFRNRILISIASKSMTLMKCGILVPKHALS